MTRSEDPERTPGRGVIFGRSSGSAELVHATALVTLFLWIMVAAWRGDHDAFAGVLYATAPLSLGAGAITARKLAHGHQRVLTAAAAILLVAAVLVLPFYSNAEAAAGVQLVALAGLLLTGALRETRGIPIGSGTVQVAVVVGVLGTVLAFRSQAAAVIVVLMICIIAAVQRRGAAPGRRTVLGVGLGSVSAAVLALLVLGTLSTWPSVLNRPGSLSGARHRLWRDALALWREHPVLGGGPGSFRVSSETAQSSDLYYAAHSSILQVAAELGAIGVVLFLAVLVSGAFVASQGDPARGLIGVAAWCALAVHSMIDHLYEFPLVCLLAGVVIGWSGARSGDRHATLTP